MVSRFLTGDDRSVSGLSDPVVLAKGPIGWLPASQYGHRFLNIKPLNIRNANLWTPIHRLENDVNPLIGTLALMHFFIVHNVCGPTLFFIASQGHLHGLDVKIDVQVFV